MYECDWKNDLRSSTIFSLAVSINLKKDKNQEVFVKKVFTLA
jgi:hypothetical protein